MNLTNKTPSHVRISINDNFPIKMSEVLLLLNNLVYSSFIALVESFNTKNK